MLIFFIGNLFVFVLAQDILGVVGFGEALYVGGRTSCQICVSLYFGRL